MTEITAHVVLEILGRPANNVTAALKGLTDRMDNEKGISVIAKEIHKPQPVEKSDLFTSFAAVDVKLDSISKYFDVLFGYMPSNIEIVKPTKLTLTNADLTDLGNRLAGRLHQYDAVTKKSLIDKEKLLNKLKEVAPELFKEQKQQNKEKKKPTKKKSKKSKKK